MDEGFLHKAEIHDDIRTLKVSKETEAEGCGGGFPCQARFSCKAHLFKKFDVHWLYCQGISCGGSQGGLDDPRSSLLRKVFATFDKMPAHKRSGYRVLTSSCERPPCWPGSWSTSRMSKAFCQRRRLCRPSWSFSSRPASPASNLRTWFLGFFQILLFAEGVRRPWFGAIVELRSLGKCWLAGALLKKSDVFGWLLILQGCVFEFWFYD